MQRSTTQNPFPFRAVLSSNFEEDCKKLSDRIDAGRAFIISAPGMTRKQRRAAQKYAVQHIEDLIKTGNRDNGPVTTHIVIFDDGAEFQIIE